ncbi:intraflagellar transport protein 57 homolog [Rhopilema esculentum]|uniref:intraflagellar transport protein 57 homolog n=1 Tax=Rhopilema esculentum TaxID=499914 RepID=UPI0031DFC91F|eukprot:gene16974-8476_t
MAEEDNRRGEGGDGAPGAQFMNSFIVMEDVLDKLKLLDYEASFCKEWGFKPFSRHYFVVATNPGEQFFAYTSIVTWTLNQCGINTERPQEYDDPNATLSSILNESRKLGIAIDFPPSKLKTGNGEHAVYLLDKLSDEALKSQRFAWKRPMHDDEEEEEEAIVEDDAELTIDKMNDELAEEIEEADDEESYLDLAGLKQQAYMNEKPESKPEAMLQSNTDSAEWQLELERVLPMLKVHIRTDNKDWRSHYEQMKQYSDGIDTSLTETKGQLDKLHQEISKTLEKIASREKYINNQLENLMQEYRGQQDQLAEAKERYKQSSGGVTELTQKLAQVTDELEQVKQQMDERGTNMTDSAPLMRIKQALSKLRQEIVEMELRIGVVEHTLQQARLQEKRNLESQNMKSTKDDYKGIF